MADDEAPKRGGAWEHQLDRELAIDATLKDHGGRIVHLEKRLPYRSVERWFLGCILMLQVLDSRAVAWLFGVLRAAIQ